jgi:hypothetical protein
VRNAKLSQCETVRNVSHGLRRRTKRAKCSGASPAKSGDLMLHASLKHEFWSQSLCLSEHPDRSSCLFAALRTYFEQSLLFRQSFALFRTKFRRAKFVHEFRTTHCLLPSRRLILQVPHRNAEKPNANQQRVRRLRISLCCSLDRRLCCAAAYAPEILIRS